MSDLNVEDTIEDVLEDKTQLAEEIEVVDEVDEVVLLKNEIDDLNSKISALDNKYLMAYADAQNITKRAKIDAENLIVKKVSDIVEDIIPALDNFERALATKTEDEQVQNFLKGFEIVYSQLYKALEKAGVERVETLNQPFDPNIHQAVAQVNDESFESGVVVEELQKGYKFRNRIIRVAMVKINE